MIRMKSKMQLLVFTLSFIYGSYGQFIPSLDGKIVGGSLVDISSYPYQVSIYYYGQHICGGSILTTSAILTAAHCVFGLDHSQFWVRVGSTTHWGGSRYKIRKVIPHPDYNPNNYNNDIAILKPFHTFPFGDRIQPIPLQPRGTEVPTGTTGWVSGWGVTHEGSNTVSTYLRAVDVRIISDHECKTRYGSNKISSHMMCAQTLYKDSCQGDSGGPLAADDKLVGVVSWGQGCARPEYPGVYTKVSAMYDWIISNF